MEDTYYIHGHMCTHNFMMGTQYHWSDPRHNYRSLLSNYQAGYLGTPRIVYAQHPMMNPDPTEYATTCEEWGFDLPWVDYTPYIGRTPEEYLAIHATFDWTQCPYANLINKENYYYKFVYQPVASIISFENWAALTVTWGAYPLGQEPVRDSITGALEKFRDITHGS